VNFTWVKGKHSLKFGYEYEHIWMAVNDNNPLYGSFTYWRRLLERRRIDVSRHLLGGLPLRHDQRVLAGQLYEAHLTQTTTASMRRTTGR
jgi:hypothetical protein